jgi:UDP-N-acetylmuramate dehydrogenase
MSMGHLSSLFQNEECVVLGAYFRLHDADPKDLRACRLSNLALRRERFPRSEPNAGSVFKRPAHASDICTLIAFMRTEMRQHFDVATEVGQRIL